MMDPRFLFPDENRLKLIRSQKKKKEKKKEKKKKLKQKLCSLFTFFFP